MEEEFTNSLVCSFRIFGVMDRYTGWLSMKSGLKTVVIGSHLYNLALKNKPGGLFCEIFGFFQAINEMNPFYPFPM